MVRPLPRACSSSSVPRARPYAGGPGPLEVVAVSPRPTATPLPNAHARLRTTGLYRFVRHPIYSGLLLAATAFTVGTGSVTRVVVLVLLVLLLTVKARWEEPRLSRRFEGHAAYASRTPRFVPVRPHR